MAATVATSRSQFQAVSFGAFRARLVKVTPDSSYPTAGYAISANSLGLSEILGVVPLGLDATVQTSGIVWQYNIQTGKLQAFASNGAAPALLAEVANTTDLSAKVFHFLVIGV